MARAKRRTKKTKKKCKSNQKGCVYVRGYWRRERKKKAKKKS